MTLDLLGVACPPDVPLDRWLRAPWHARRRLVAARLAASPPSDDDVVRAPRPRAELCARGHTLDDAYEQTSRGKRECRTCRRDRDRERARRRRAAARAAAVTPTPATLDRTDLAS